jgi:hypothetical protein
VISSVRVPHLGASAPLSDALPAESDSIPLYLELSHVSKIFQNFWDPLRSEWHRHGTVHGAWTVQFRTTHLPRSSSQFSSTPRKFTVHRTAPVSAAPCDPFLRLLLPLCHHGRFLWLSLSSGTLGMPEFRVLWVQIRRFSPNDDNLSLSPRSHSRSTTQC